MAPRLNLLLQLQIRHTTRQYDFFGNYGRWRQGHGDVFGTGSTFFNQSPQSISNLVEFLDVPVGDPTALKRLNGATLQNEIAAFVAPQLHQFDAGRADIQPQ